MKILDPPSLPPTEALPDLIVKNVARAEGTNLQITVANIGDGDAGECVIGISIFKVWPSRDPRIPGSAGIPRGELQGPVPALPAGKEVTFLLDTRHAGPDYGFIVTIDSTNQVKETNEKNNTYRLNLPSYGKAATKQ